MSTYTREQIKSALRDSDNYTSSCGGELVGDPEEHRVDALAEALGLDVEDEKPEPGVYLTDGDGIGFVDHEGDFYLLNLTGKNYKEPILPRCAGAYSARLACVISAAEYQRLIQGVLK